MANDNKAKFTRIGITVILGVVAVVVTLIWLGGAGIGRSEVLVESYSDNPVSGLSVGSDVNLRGVKIGEVRKISFVGGEFRGVSEEDKRKIYIVMALNAKSLGTYEESAEVLISRLIHRGLRATVTASGITGLSKIELNFPKLPKPLKPITWTPVHMCIPPEPSMLDSFSDAVTEVMNELRDVDFGTVWSNVTSIASSVSSLSQTADSVMQSQRGRIEEILFNLENASRGLSELVREVKDNPSLLIRETGTRPLKETRR